MNFRDLIISNLHCFSRVCPIFREAYLYVKAFFLISLLHQSSNAISSELIAQRQRSNGIFNKQEKKKKKAHKT